MGRLTDLKNKGDYCSMDEKKKYVNPEAEIIEFKNDDIITLSEGVLAGMDGEDMI